MNIEEVKCVMRSMCNIISINCERIDPNEKLAILSGCGVYGSEFMKRCVDVGAVTQRCAGGLLHQINSRLMLSTDLTMTEKRTLMKRRQ